MPYKNKRNNGTRKMSALAEQFTELTGASTEEAMDFLSASNGNLRLAVNLFYQSNQKVSAKDEHEEDASSTVGPKTSTPKASTAKGRFKAAVGKVGKMVKKMVGGGASGTGKMSVRRRGQAKEQTNSESSTSASSSSMRKSKQNAAADDDADDLDSSPELRAPDQPKKEVLVRDTLSSYSSSFSANRGQLHRWKMQSHRQSLSPDGHRPLQSSASVFAGTPSVSTEQHEPEQQQPHLDRLFLPPVDLIFEVESSDSSHLNVFEAAKKAAVEQGKWLLVNLQRCSRSQPQFASLALNRDLWSDRAVKALLKAHFIFLQLELEEEGEGQGRGHEENAVGLGQQLAGFYQVTETPFVALLDPRTGEKLLSWSAGNEQLACAEVWCNAVDDFLRSQGERLLKKEVVAPLKTNAAAKSSVLDVQAMSEEEQLKAAIEASLRDLQLQQKNQPEVKKASVVGVSSSSSWKQYLGPENSGKQSLQFVIRLPDGSRRPVSFPADSKVKALQLYLEEEFKLKENSYQLVTLFPKKCIVLGAAHLSESNDDKEGMATLEAAGFKHRDTFYLQMK
ncbi:UBX domain-containing protein 7 [Tyrophagus putrescentiae]|nr:UBX domain-containing protein 7 [Tyrophagus putrescentiae]